MSLHIKLKNIGYKSYGDYLKSQRWLSFVEKYKGLRQFRCAVCDTRDHVKLRHKNCDRIGNELLDDVIPLCTQHTLGEYLRKLSSENGKGITTNSNPYVGIKFKRRKQRQWLKSGSICPKCSGPMKPGCGYNACLKCEGTI